MEGLIMKVYLPASKKQLTQGKKNEVKAINPPGANQ
jgi:hypothetical protein